MGNEGSSLKDHMTLRHGGVLKYPKEYVQYVVDNLSTHTVSCSVPLHSYDARIGLMIENNQVNSDREVSS